MDRKEVIGSTWRERVGVMGRKDSGLDMGSMTVRQQVQRLTRILNCRYHST